MPEYKECASCDNLIRKTDNFCEECGQAQPSMNEEEVAQYNKRKPMVLADVCISKDTTNKLDKNGLSAFHVADVMKETIEDEEIMKKLDIYDYFITKDKDFEHPKRILVRDGENPVERVRNEIKGYRQ